MTTKNTTRGTDMEQIGSYVNGNTIVVMYDGGTKERYVRDGETPNPIFPESMDIKITNRCDAGCPMCAECSTPGGQHGNLNHPVFDSIHPYTELAIGGGNPLEHPDLLDFLKRMKRMNVICNLTVNQKHFMENLGYLHLLTDHGYIHGLGVSVPLEPAYGLINKLQYFPNAVVHTIAGFTPVQTYQKLAKHDINLLILGYKTKGLGRVVLNSSGDVIGQRLDELQEYLMTGGYKNYKAVAFDNLAVEQLMCKKWMTADVFDKFYMGDDGEYTMYIDLVKEEYAKSSTHPTKPIGTDVVSELFAKIR